MSMFSRPLLAAAMAATLMLTTAPDASAQSGRLSLSERIAKLEGQNQGQASQTTVDLLNRVSQLQSEVQTLRGTVEQQAFEIEEMKKRARDQYVDLDSRIARMEGGNAAAAQSNAPAMAEPAAGFAGTSVPPVSTNPADISGARMDATGAEMSLANPDAAVDASGTPSMPATQPITGNPALAGNPVSTLPNQTADEQATYDAAFSALREGRYAESARRFSGFLEQFPNGDLADNATYWLGESYYVTQNYGIAQDTFRTLLDRFPQSAKAPDALLKLGFCHYELRQWSEAEAALNKVVQLYPDNSVARLAQGRLRALRLEGRTP